MYSITILEVMLIMRRTTEAKYYLSAARRVYSLLPLLSPKISVLNATGINKKDYWSFIR